MSTEAFTFTFDEEAFECASTCIMFHDPEDIDEEYAEGFDVLWDMFSKSLKTCAFTDYVWECFKSLVDFHDQEDLPEEYWDGFDTLQAMFDEPEVFAC